MNGQASAGAVDLYDDQGTFVGERTTPPGRPIAPNDRFGFAVASAGGLLVVGAPGASVGVAEAAGRAYLFTPAGDPIELDPGDRAAGDHFGYAVAGVGSSVLVGAPGATTTAPNAGAIYLFDSDGTLVKKLTLGSQASADDALGYAVAAHGDDVLGGAPRPGTTRSGSAFLFDANTGAVVATFLSSSPSAGDYFGAAVASTGADVIVGAPLDDRFAANAGIVYVFSDANPSHSRARKPTIQEPDSLFGAAIAIVGTDFVVGAPRESTGSDRAGTAYRIEESTGTVTGVLVAPIPMTDGLFGSSLATSGATIAFGAPGAGRVHLAVCPDGVRDPGEVCDTADDATCPNACNRTTCACGAVATCGNGILEGREECDDGNATDGDGCDRNCTSTRCGNSIVTAGEECDDGNATDGDGCDRNCVRSPCGGCDDHDPCTVDTCDTQSGVCTHTDCTDVGAVCPIACLPSACGNGSVEPGETCDPPGSQAGNLWPPRYCRNDCTYCGDKIVDRGDGETCDDGNAVGGCGVIGDTCLNSCTPPQCSGCTKNGQCDDGDPCDGSERCTGGECVAGTPLDCDDSDPCTDDGCTPFVGCTHIRQPGCCTTNSDCDNTCRHAGTCKLCNYCDVFAYGEACCRRPMDLPQCVRGTVAPDGTPCMADADVCTSDVCLNGDCTVGDPVDCDDGNPCTTDFCHPVAGCGTTAAVDGTPCGDLCNPGLCGSGQCAFGIPLDCDDANPCTSDSCDPSRVAPCVHQAIADCCDTGGDCRDTDACTTNERCEDRQCLSDPVPCVAPGGCAVATCRPSDGCTVTQRADGDACTYDGGGDACIVGNAQCRQGECVPARACDITTQVKGEVTPGGDCVRAAKALQVVVDCMALGDDSGTRKQRKRAFCRAVAKTVSGGKVLAGPGKAHFGGSDEATIKLALTQGARRQLCRNGRVDASVQITLRNRKGATFAVTRPVSLTVGEAERR